MDKNTNSAGAAGREGEEDGAGGLGADCPLCESLKSVKGEECSNCGSNAEQFAHVLNLERAQWAKGFVPESVEGAASAEPQRAFGQIQVELAGKIIGILDRYYNDDEYKPYMACSALLALLGEAPPKAEPSQSEMVLRDALEHGRNVTGDELREGLMQEFPQIPTPGATVQPQADTCEWKESDPDFESLWETTCGRSWTFPEGGPTENEVNFCIGCGKPTKIIRYVPEPEDDDEPQAEGGAE